MLSPEAIDEAWEEMATHVGAHTPPTLHDVFLDFTDRLNARR